MSPEQLKTLQKLSQLFEDGSARPQHVKQLSVLLAEINQLENWPEENMELMFSRH